MRSSALFLAVVVIHAPGLRGTPRSGQHLERHDERVLHRLLGEVEVAEHADERRDRPPGLLPKQALDRLRRGAYRAASASARFVCTCDPAAS
ncbi:MAG: hypothetical protein QOI76_2615 [Frankiales bacterium]|nr:hypothetical protein [Frankiales bacterium]